jgi:uncharacterized membrane protein HdeD (DUF308 family)
MGPVFERGGVATGPARAAYGGGSTFAWGLVLFLAGFLALIFADVVTVASILVFGVLLVVAGIVDMVQSRRHREEGRAFPGFLSGLLTLAVGAVILFRPGVGVAGSALLIAGWLLAAGLFRGVIALMDRYRFWGWDLAYGVLSVVLGFWLMANMPTTAMWLLGTVVAIELMARGVAVMAASIAIRRIERTAAAA